MAKKCEVEGLKIGDRVHYSRTNSSGHVTGVKNGFYYVELDDGTMIYAGRVALSYMPSPELIASRGKPFRDAGRARGLYPNYADGSPHTASTTGSRGGASVEGRDWL